MIERLAQAPLVEVTREFVVIGGLLQLEFVRLAAVDEAPHAMHLDGTPDLVEQRRPAVMHPGEAAALGADAVFAVEGGVTGPMRVEPLLAQQQVVGV